MKRVIFLIFLFAFSLLSYAANEESTRVETPQTEQAVESAPTDQEIRQILIQRSINSYSGNCPCPFSRASNGSRCGGRSAYSRPGGASPLCFDADVTDAMVRNYRNSPR